MLVKIKVKPGAMDEGLAKVGKDEYEARVVERPEKGKANQSLLRLLTKEFNVPPKSIVIKNLKSRKKVVEIR